MQYSITNVAIQQQLTGLGVPISIVTMELDWAEYVTKPLSNQFILRFQFSFQNRTYYFANIYKLSDISQKKLLQLGAFTLLGLYTGPSDIQNEQVTITYVSDSAN